MYWSQLGAYTGPFNVKHIGNVNPAVGSICDSWVVTFNATTANSIYQSIDEVRPENSTIKIWKRTA